MTVSLFGAAIIALVLQLITSNLWLTVAFAIGYTYMFASMVGGRNE